MKKLLLTLLAVVCAVSSSWADETIEIVYSDFSNTSYSATESTFDKSERTFGYINVMKNGSNGTPTGWAKDQVIQCKASSSFYNKTPISYLKSVRVYLVANTNAFTVTAGSTSECNGYTQARPTTATGTETIAYTKYENQTTSSASTSTSYYDFDLSEVDEAQYFKITNGSGVLYIHKIVLTYEDPTPKHTAHFSVNGVINNGDDCEVKENAAITFPADPADIYGKIFQGWTKTADYSNATVAPSDLCKAANMGNADVTYYAVFATLSGKPVWTEITSAPEAGTYAIYAGGHFLKATISNSRFENGTQVGQDVVDGKLLIEPETDCIWEISKPDEYYRLKNGTNYAGGTSSKNQGALLTDASADLAKWTITCNTQFEVVNYGRSRGTDPNNKYLRNNGSYGWATYASSTGSAPRFFKREGDNTYSNYCTTVSAPNTFDLTIGSSNWASMYLDFAAEVPVGATAYYASSVANDIITLTSIDAGEVIPANTGVLVNGSSCTFTESNATPATVTGNLFEGVTVATPCVAEENWVLNTASTEDFGAPVLSLYTGTTLGANKAYLPASNVPSGAKSLKLVIDGESTGINAVHSNAQNGVAYNLAGQRVAANAKGLVIMNGKKFINK